MERVILCRWCHRIVSRTAPDVVVDGKGVCHECAQLLAQFVLLLSRPAGSDGVEQDEDVADEMAFDTMCVLWGRRLVGRSKEEVLGDLALVSIKRGDAVSEFPK